MNARAAQNRRLRNLWPPPTIPVMTDLSFLVAPLIAFFIAAGSPGPATLACASAAMAHGRAAGLALGVGLALGLSFWGALTAVGLGAVVLGSPTALLALRLAGGAYLLWLAWRSTRSALRTAEASTGPAPSPDRLVMRGALLNFSNPKAALAWAAVIAVGLPAGAGAWHLTAIAAACSALGLVIYLSYAVGFALPPVRRFYARARRAIDGALAALFGYAGLRLIFTKVDPA